MIQAQRSTKGLTEVAQTIQKTELLAKEYAKT